MPERRVATPSDAKAVWDSFTASGTKPTVRLVTDAMNASGEFSSAVSKSTIARWHKADWQTNAQSQVHGGEAKAVAGLQAAVTAITGKATTRLADVVPGEKPADVTNDTVARLTTEVAPAMIVTNPEGLAKLLTAVTAGELHLAQADKKRAETDQIRQAPPKDVTAGGAIVIEDPAVIEQDFVEIASGGA